jgi:hypothetical protein
MVSMADPAAEARSVLMTATLLAVAWSFGIASSWSSYRSSDGILIAFVICLASCTALTVSGWTSSWRWSIIAGSFLALAGYGWLTGGIFNVGGGSIYFGP